MLICVAEDVQLTSEQSAAMGPATESWVAEMDGRGVRREGMPLQPVREAATVRVRDGETLLTDGPFVEGAEVANGFYVLSAADREEAAKLASMIPATTVEVRQLMGVAGL